MDGSTVFFILIALMIGVPMYLDWQKKEELRQEEARKRQAEEDLKKNNPDLWEKQQRMQLEREKMAHEKELEEKRMKHDNLQTGMGVGASLARIFFGK